MEPLLGSYNNRVHNFWIDFDNSCKYVHTFLSVSCFPIFENNKKLKEGKSPKRKIKGLENKKIKKNRKWTPNKKEIKIKHESDTNPSATTVTLLQNKRLCAACSKFHNPWEVK